MNGETLIWLNGAEYELRPVSAEGWLAAKAEAAELEKTYGEDGETKSLLLAACLSAKGVFAGGERAFQNGAEALKALTPQEIAFAAAEYAFEMPDISRPPENGTAEAEMMRTPAGEAEEDAVRKEDGVTYPVFGKKYGTGIASGRGEKDREVYIMQETDGGYSLRETMAETSDFFERDSRRFDTGFERY